MRRFPRLQTYVAVGIFLLAPFSATASTTVHIWFKAFIAKEHPNLKDYIVKTDRGSWVVRGPPVPLPASFEMAKLNGTCFATDNRLFEKNPDASARVTVEFDLVIDGRNLAIENARGLKKKVFIGPTHNVDCKTGIDLQDPKTAADSTVSIGGVEISNFRRSIQVQASSPNPFFTIGSMNIAPRIDFEITIQYDLLSRALMLTGRTGYFPSFEGYYQINASRIEDIIRVGPYGAATAMSLMDFGTGLNMRTFESRIDLAHRENSPSTSANFFSTDYQNIFSAVVPKQLGKTGTANLYCLLYDESAVAKSPRQDACVKHLYLFRHIFQCRMRRI